MRSIDLGYVESGRSMTLEQVIEMLVMRKHNLNRIYEGDSPTAIALRAIREDELDCVLEILREMRL